MSTREYHLQEQDIPEGFQIFEEHLEVAGVSFRKEDATSFAYEKNGWLELERELDNKYDKNAIKVIGCTKGFLGVNRRFVGYVPKKVSHAIIEGGHWKQIRPRLLKTYVGNSGFVEILFQILGPKDKKYQYKQGKSSKATDYTDFLNQVEQLNQEKKYEDAIKLLLKLIDDTEKEVKESTIEGSGVIPQYYEKLAIIYRKDKRYDDEIAILERYGRQPKTLHTLSNKLAERLTKTRKLRDKQNA